MMKSIRFWCRLAGVAAGLAGIIANIIFQGALAKALAYYTLQSNVLAVLVMMLLLVAKEPLPRLIKRLKLAACGGILITFIVYHAILYPLVISSGEIDYPFWFDFPVHTFFPLLVLGDFLLFDREVRLEWRDAPWILALPAFYLIFVEVYVALDGSFFFDGTESRYPYFFLNRELLGNGIVALLILALAVLALSLGFGLVAIDRKLALRKAGKLE